MARMRTRTHEDCSAFQSSWEKFRVAHEGGLASSQKERAKEHIPVGIESMIRNRKCDTGAKSLRAKNICSSEFTVMRTLR